MVRALLLSLVFLATGVVASQDPTAPLGWLQPETPSVQKNKKKAVRYSVPTLQSIVCVGEQPCHAILNGEVLAQGESIHGYRVKTIDPEYVYLQKNSKKWKLELFSLDIKNN